MGLLKGLIKTALSPLKAVSEIIDDVKGGNGGGEQALATGTFGISSAVKGLAKGIKKGVDEVFEDDNS